MKYTCRYTGIETEDVVWVGATIPGVKARYPVANTPEALAMHKASQRAFHESDANCNTCKHLQRVQHEKSVEGFLYARCLNKQADHRANPYLDRFGGDIMMFHPDDWMGMPCYESRWA